MNALFYSIYSKPANRYILLLLRMCIAAAAAIVSYVAWQNPTQPLHAVVLLIHLSFNTLFVAYSFLAFFLITLLFVEKEKRRRLLGFVVMVYLINIGYCYFINQNSQLIDVVRFSFFLFLFSALFLAWKIFWDEKEKSRYFWRYIADFSLLPLQAVLSIYFSGAFDDKIFNPGAAHGLLFANRDTLDYILYSFDSSLGIPIYQLFAAWLQQNLIYIIAITGYTGLIGVVMISQYLQRRHPNRAPAEIVLSFTLAGVLGTALYNIIPACGIRYLFGPDFPYNLPPGGTKYAAVYTDMPTNAMPSLHFTWALLLLFHSCFYGKKYIAVFTLYAFLIFIGVLGSGEHYLIDLIVAFPLALFVQAACTKNWSAELKYLKYCSMASGGILVGTWLIFLRYGMEIYSGNTLLCWSLNILSTAICIFLSIRIYQSTKRTGDI